MPRDVDTKTSEPNERSLAASETRENILEVATAEFADKGLAGARIDEVAEKTASSKRMIYYYFGGKEELYRAVLERSYRSIRTREMQTDFAALPPTEAMAAHVSETFDYHAKHPDFVRLVMNENIHRGEHIQQIDGLRELNKMAIDTMRQILKRGEKSGDFRPGIDPLDLHMTLSSLCFYNVSNRYTIEANFGVDLASQRTMKRRRDLVIDVILRFCAR